MIPKIRTDHIYETSLFINDNFHILHEARFNRVSIIIIAWNWNLVCSYYFVCFSLNDLINQFMFRSVIIDCHRLHAMLNVQYMRRTVSQN